MTATTKCWCSSPSITAWMAGGTKDYPEHFAAGLAPLHTPLFQPHGPSNAEPAPQICMLAERSKIVVRFDAVAFILGLGYVMGLRSSMILVAGGGHRTLNVGGEGADFVPFFLGLR